MSRPQSPVRSQLAFLRWQLLLASLGITALTLGVGGFGVYQVVARSLYGRLDQALFNLADAAAHTLPPALPDNAPIAPTGMNLQEDETHDSEHGPEAEQAQGETPENQETGRYTDDDTEAYAYAQANPAIDTDGDLDLSWQNLRQPHQSIEWFDDTGQRVLQVGDPPPDQPLFNRVDPQQTEDLRWLTMPVYSSDVLQGYVRVSSGTAQVSSELDRLRWGLLWGGLAALGISGLGSWGLMRLAMGPIERGVDRLRQFTADASHELRSPLTAIKTSVEVMQSHPERIHWADVKKVQLIASASEQMSGLVNDLLLLARLDDALVIDGQTAVIPMDELLEDVTDFYHPQATTQGLNLVTKLAAPAARVRGDGSQLKRLFINLLDNACKYTPAPGTVTLRSQLQDTTVVIYIADTGIGIAPEHISQVYNRFWRADPVRSHHHGSGLGLAIAQSIVNAHQGSITITSQLSQGTTVQVKLPLS